MNILGVSAFYHDSAAALLQDNKIVAAAQEERFTRIKHDSEFPIQSIKYCLGQAGLTPSDLSAIVFYEKPFIKLERIFETYLAFAPMGLGSFLYSSSSWITDKLFQKKKICRILRSEIDPEFDWSNILLFSEHHLSHAASAFFPSPFQQAAILTVDGVGEWATATIAIGKGSDIEIVKEMRFPHSVGLLYSAFTYYCGFKVNSGEYKLMGLAPYGKPKYAELIKSKLITVFDDGSIQLDMHYFGFGNGLTMTNANFHALFEGEPHPPEAPLTQRVMDIAASIQAVTEEIIYKMAMHVSDITGERRLCMAGGVALNCVANGRLAQSGIFDEIWVQPAAGDAGGAIGAALAAGHMHFDTGNRIAVRDDGMSGSLLGPEYSDQEIERALLDLGASYRRLNRRELIAEVVSHLTDQAAVGWMQGRMEFGPRALGNRSILADPRSQEMQRTLNLKIKQRESFRPFAPSVMLHHANEWFTLPMESPYMSLVASLGESKKVAQPSQPGENSTSAAVNPTSAVPAVTHVDFTARVQTVNETTNPIFHDLIATFYDMTGTPMLVNTSFNVRGEPIVCSPKDAFRCFMTTGLDVLVIGNYLLLKEEQDMSIVDELHMAFPLD